MSKIDKPVLVFVPGLGATGVVYEPLLKRLRKTYDVRVAMHPLEFPQRLDWNFFFRPIDQAAGSAKEFRLLGHSMGGAIALAYAARYPKRVRRVVAVAPPTTPRRHAEFRGLTRFRFWRRLQNLALGIRSGNPSHALESVRIRSDVLADGRRQRLYDWANQVDLSRDLSKLRNASVLWMGSDEVLYRDHLELVKQHPSVSLKIIPGSHNYLPLHPGPIFKYVKEALDG